MESLTGLFSLSLFFFFYRLPTFDDKKGNIIARLNIHHMKMRSPLNQKSYAETCLRQSAQEHQNLSLTEKKML